MPVRNRIAEMQSEIAAWRRDFHENPELGYDTHRTAGIVAGKLREFGCDEVTEGVGRTGVVGVIRGRAGGRVVGLRADMDALPIEEATGKPWASKVPGRMHACGHDGHSAMLLGAARYLAETRNFDGTVVVVFQPAEEGGAGGDAMVRDGLMERWGIEEIYGMHNMPGLPVGQFAIRPGPFFAATDEFEITVEGRGGHAAMPQNTVDTVVLCSQIVMGLQTIVSRNADPTAQLVVSVTSLQTEGTAFNVIPQRAVMRGTVRTLDPALSTLAEARIRKITEATAEALGGSVTIDYRKGYPVMVNAPDQTEVAAEAARRIAGGVVDAPLVMGSEDFAFMLQTRPGAYILVGNGATPMVHHPGYDFDDEAIPAGVSWWVELVESRMAAAG